MATNFGDHVGRDEFEFPDEIDNSAIELVKEIRRVVGRPMTFSRLNGHLLVKGRDARHFPETSTDFSLHRVGIDHEASIRLRKPVLDPNFLCRAIDFTLKTSSFDDFMDVAKKISVIVGAGGCGLYPNWNIPGFHVDTRNSSHLSAYARWFAYSQDNGEQTYVYSSHDWSEANVSHARQVYSNRW